MVALLPVKSKAKAARTRYFHYFVLRHEEQMYLRKRTRQRHLAGPLRLCHDRDQIAQICHPPICCATSKPGGQIGYEYQPKSRA